MVYKLVLSLNVTGLIELDSINYFSSHSNIIVAEIDDLPLLISQCCDLSSNVLHLLYH